MKDSHQPKPLSEEEMLLAAGYVLGDLTPQEIAELEQLVTQKPALLQEIHAQQASFELMPQGLTQVEAPPNLLTQTALPQPVSTPTPSPRREQSNLIPKLIAAGVALISLALVTDNLRLRHQLQLLQKVRPDRVASVLQQPNSRLISLTGNSTDAAGTLLFTPGRWQEVIVSLGNLPPLPPEQIYRMWLGLENGRVIYCGGFNTDSTGSVFVRFTPPENPPTGVKATELFVTIDANSASPNIAGERVMEGTI